MPKDMRWAGCMFLLVMLSVATLALGQGVTQVLAGYAGILAAFYTGVSAQTMAQRVRAERLAVEVAHQHALEVSK